MARCKWRFSFWRSMSLQQCFYVRPRELRQHIGANIMRWWLGDSKYYVSLPFSTKKLASLIRYVLNKRVVGRGGWGRRSARSRGCSTGGTRSSAALPGRREILICASYPAQHPSRPHSPHAPVPPRPVALDSAARPPLPPSHTACHPLQILITFRTTYFT